MADEKYFGNCGPDKLGMVDAIVTETVDSEVSAADWYRMVLAANIESVLNGREGNTTDLLAVTRRCDDPGGVQVALSQLVRDGNSARFFGLTEEEALTKLDSEEVLKKTPVQKRECNIRREMVKAGGNEKKYVIESQTLNETLAEITELAKKYCSAAEAKSLAEEVIVRLVKEAVRLAVKKLKLPDAFSFDIHEEYAGGIVKADQDIACILRNNICAKEVLKTLGLQDIAKQISAAVVSVFVPPEVSPINIAGRCNNLGFDDDFLQRIRKRKNDRNQRLRAKKSQRRKRKPRGDKHNWN